MKLRTILNEIMNEGISDEQGVVSSDGTSIDLKIPTTKQVKVKEKVPKTSYYKMKNGNMVAVTIREPENGKIDGLPVIDKKESKNYTQSDEYWIRVVKNENKDKITFEDIIVPITLTFHYNPSSDQPFTVRDDKNKIVGVAIVADSEDKESIHIFNVNIKEEYRGRGVANAFYDFIEKNAGKKITRDTKGIYKALSDDGAGMWNKRNSR